MTPCCDKQEAVFGPIAATLRPSGTCLMPSVSSRLKKTSTPCTLVKISQSYVLSLSNAESKSEKSFRGTIWITGKKIGWAPAARSEEHTSELQSQSNLVCRLLL